jgi:uncharacterized membrane protein YdjX (TVP38/TMEM64 family)
LFGATRVPLWPYLAATLIGISPGVIVQVSAGALNRTALETAMRWLLAPGLVASALAVVMIDRRAQGVLYAFARGCRLQHLCLVDWSGR